MRAPVNALIPFGLLWRMIATAATATPPGAPPNGRKGFAQGKTRHKKQAREEGRLDGKTQPEGFEEMRPVKLKRQPRGVQGWNGSQHQSCGHPEVKIVGEDFRDSHSTIAKAIKCLVPTGGIFKARWLDTRHECG